MTVFVDTSALFAHLDRDDENHTSAERAFDELLGDEPLTTHNYIVLESAALVQRRLGPDAVRALLDDLVPALELVWVDEHLHRTAAAALIASGSREISLVDWTSFEVMRRLGIEKALAFDEHFAAQGFRLLR